MVASEIETPWSPVGYIVYKRTYARRLEGNSMFLTEEWQDTVSRCIKSIGGQLKGSRKNRFTEEEGERLARYLLSLKCSLAGRFLWQLGTKTVDRLGLSSLQNCAFVPIRNPEDFCFIFDFLMLGCGVGFSVASKDISNLPEVSEAFKVPVAHRISKDADYIVPDSREGWVALLSLVLETAFGGESRIANRRVSGVFVRPGFSYSTALIRSKGSPIAGFGGVASGPDILIDGIEKISQILFNARGRKLTSVECLDIACIIGSIVVAGNVRRSALIAIGDPNDKEYLRAKRWDLGTIPYWRAMSNNSVYCSNIEELAPDFWEGYFGNGEPYGLINIDLAAKYGRLGEKRYDNCQGFNPCAEQSLAPYETCCLAEIFLPMVESKEELFDIATLLYKVCKLSLMLPCHDERTEEIVHSNMRMGIGVTGYLQSTEEQRSWLRECYSHLRTVDEVYSRQLGVPQSIKITTVKPSGTLSLLPGVTPGVHPAFARYIIRRIRLSSSDPLVGLIADHGYKIEYQKMLDGSVDHSTVVAEFPMEYPEGTKIAEKTSVFDQLGYIEELQRDWSDNSVSCTVYYNKGEEEIESLKKFLSEKYSTTFKSLSFLPRVGHGFEQAPLEEIDEQTYIDMTSKVRPISSSSALEYFKKSKHGSKIGMAFDPVVDECDTGACPIR